MLGGQCDIDKLFQGSGGDKSLVGVSSREDRQGTGQSMYR